MPPGDPRRRVIGVAAVGALALSLLFVVAAYAAKELRWLYLHAPWQDDPYDAVVSFTIFFVPLTAAVNATRLALCRRDQPLPWERARLIIRGSRFASLLVTLTLGADWISVATRTDPGAWTQVTAYLIVGLAVISVPAVIVLVALHRASRLLPPATDASSDDWLADAAATAAWYARTLGPPGRRWADVAIRLEQRIAAQVRARPLAIASALALAFAGLLVVATAIGEGPGAGLWIDVVVATSAMFAFAVAAGSHLRLVVPLHPLHGARRRMVDAVVSACAAVPVALALRGSLWWLVGGGSPHPGQLLELLGVAAACCFVAVLAAETVARSHTNSGLTALLEPSAGAAHRDPRQQQ